MGQMVSCFYPKTKKREMKSRHTGTRFSLMLPSSIRLGEQNPNRNGMRARRSTERNLNACSTHKHSILTKIERETHLLMRLVRIHSTQVNQKSGPSTARHRQKEDIIKIDSR